MLYNTLKGKEKKNLDCLSCEYYDIIEKKCNGVGKVCFEYDEKTKTLIDPITKLPISIDTIRQNRKNN